jgi:hypothetical protein
MTFLSFDGDEVVLARLKGHLDGVIDKALAAADCDGPQGARAALGGRVGPSAAAGPLTPRAPRRKSSTIVAVGRICT